MLKHECTTKEFEVKIFLDDNWIILSKSFKKCFKQKKLRINPKLFNFLKQFSLYFTASTTAAKACGSFIAKSAKTLRFNPMFLLANLPIN